MLGTWLPSRGSLPQSGVYEDGLWLGFRGNALIPWDGDYRWLVLGLGIAASLLVECGVFGWRIRSAGADTPPVFNL